MEEKMTKRKAVTFDAMVKFFMHNYKIPTKRDIDRIESRLDRLEKLIRGMSPHARRSVSKGDDLAPKSATDTVLEFIKFKKDGVGFPEIQEHTGYNDKKLRNIIFRLHQVKKIKRVSRGSYKIADS
jgi:hypothetical protein